MPLELKAAAESVCAGNTAEGWRHKVLLKFVQPGLFLHHCHNLEHEDQRMMRNFRVEAWFPVVL